MPYNTTACDWDVKIDLAKYWKTRLRVLKPTGVVVLTSKQPFTSELVLSNRQLFKYEMIWQKDRLTNIFTVKYRVGDVHENILVFYMRQGIYNPQKTEGWISKNRPNCKTKVKLSKGNTTETMGVAYTPANMYSELVNPVSVIKLTRERSHKIKRLHPTQKPVGLFEYLIRTYTNEGDLVFDGFGGSGTTAIAAYRSKRRFIVVEKEKKYFELSEKRLAEEVKQCRLF